MSVEDAYFTYRNCGFVQFKNDVRFDGLSHSVGALNQNANDYLFLETVEITGSAIACLFQNRNSSEARDYIRNRVMIKAKARLEAHDYPEDGTGKYSERINSLSVKDPQAVQDEDLIQLRVLRTLLNIRQMNPISYKSDHLEMEGFCALYDIKSEQLVYLLTILEERNYIGTLDLASGKVFITMEGIEYLKSADNAIKVESNPVELKRWDVFISHASEDKPLVVEPLAKELHDVHGLEVWYDKWTLRLGDSLRRKIDEGLASSRYGVVVLSPDFFSKEWPQCELDGLFAKETINGGKKVILPVVHNMTNVELSRYSLFMASKLAANTRVGIPEIARQIAEIVLDTDIAGIYPDVKFEHLELNVQYLKLKDLSDAEQHTYELVVKAKLNSTPMLKQFRLYLLWPERVQTKKVTDFERGDRRLIEGQVYKELILEYDKVIYPGQEIEIVGPTCNYQIQYIFNDDTFNYVNSSNVVLKYTVFREDAMPCEGEIGFAQLNDF